MSVNTNSISRPTIESLTTLPESISEIEIKTGGCNFVIELLNKENTQRANSSHSVKGTINRSNINHQEFEKEVIELFYNEKTNEDIIEAKIPNKNIYFGPVEKLSTDIDL